MLLFVHRLVVAHFMLLLEVFAITHMNLAALWRSRWKLCSRVAGLLSGAALVMLICCAFVTAGFSPRPMATGTTAPRSDHNVTFTAAPTLEESTLGEDAVPYIPSCLGSGVLTSGISIHEIHKWDADVLRHLALCRGKWHQYLIKNASSSTHQQAATSDPIGASLSICVEYEIKGGLTNQLQLHTDGFFAAAMLGASEIAVPQYGLSRPSANVAASRYELWKNVSTRDILDYDKVQRLASTLGLRMVSSCSALNRRDVPHDELRQASSNKIAICQRIAWGYFDTYPVLALPVLRSELRRQLQQQTPSRSVLLRLHLVIPIRWGSCYCAAARLPNNTVSGDDELLEFHVSLPTQKSCAALVDRLSSSSRARDAATRQAALGALHAHLRNHILPFPFTQVAANEVDTSEATFIRAWLRSQGLLPGTPSSSSSVVNRDAVGGFGLFHFRAEDDATHVAPPPRKQLQAFAAAQRHFPWVKTWYVASGIFNGPIDAFKHTPAVKHMLRAQFEAWNRTAARGDDGGGGPAVVRYLPFEHPQRQELLKRYANRLEMLSAVDLYLAMLADVVVGVRESSFTTYAVYWRHGSGGSRCAVSTGSWWHYSLTEYEALTGKKVRGLTRAPRRSSCFARS